MNRRQQQQQQQKEPRQQQAQPRQQHRQQPTRKSFITTKDLVLFLAAQCLVLLLVTTRSSRLIHQSPIASCNNSGPGELSAVPEQPQHGRALRQSFTLADSNGASINNNNGDEDKIIHRSSTQSSQSPQQPPNQLLYGTMERPFAETIAEFKEHLMYLVRDDPTIYSEQDIALLAKASRLSIDFFQSAWRLSGKMGLNHEIGTASCVMHFKIPAVYVALAALHGAYFGIWGEDAVGVSHHPFFYPNDACRRRRWIQDQLGEEFEAILWQYYTTQSGSPHLLDPHYWLSLLKRDNIMTDVDKYMMVFSLCDELEQYQSSEQLWVDNDRARTEEFQRDFLAAMDALASDDLFRNKDPDSTFGLMKQYAQQEFKRTNDWYGTSGGNEVVSSETGGMNTNSHERRFKQLFEPLFRNTSHVPFVNWAHIPEVQKSIASCRGKRRIQKCIDNFEKIRDYWKGVCCDKGGPCPEDFAPPTGNKPFLSEEERVKLFLPKIDGRLSPNIVGLQCLNEMDGIKAHELKNSCRGVEGGRLPEFSHAYSVEVKS